MLREPGHHLSSLQELDNGELLQLASSGEALAWKQLITRFEPLVRSVARSFGLNEADVLDVAQLTWIKLFKNLQSIRNAERLGAWLAVTASREASQLRKGARHTVELEQVPAQLADHSPGPEIEVTQRDTAQIIWAVVDELPARQRLLLRTMFRDDARGYGEIRDTCSMPIGSIGPTRARALEQLRRKLDERGLGLQNL
jgi:RNA polymerase sigma factor (sigma-70 family)